MKSYLVTIVLITGYHSELGAEPILRSDEYTVEATDCMSAIEEAKKLDKTQLCVWESYAEELD